MMDRKERGSINILMGICNFIKPSVVMRVNLRMIKWRAGESTNVPMAKGY